MNKRIAAEVLGWAGTVTVVIAYALVSFKIISATGVVYPLLNIFGALGIIAISIYKGIRQTVVLNVFWALIAVVALVSLIFNHS